MKILILCTGNSCRSQMAHGFLQSFDANLQVFSAGTHPAEQVNPQAVEVMAETGIDISHHRPTDVATCLNETWDYVITVCDHARESCPAFSGEVRHRLHIGIEDPSEVTGSPETIRQAFIQARDLIKERFSRFYLTEIRGKNCPDVPVNDKFLNAMFVILQTKKT